MPPLDLLTFDGGRFALEARAGKGREGFKLQKGE